MNSLYEYKDYIGEKVIKNGVSYSVNPNSIYLYVVKRYHREDVLPGSLLETTCVPMIHLPGDTSYTYLTSADARCEQGSHR